MKKGLVYIFRANIIYLIINILNSFLLPKFLSVNTYAIIKTYALYIGYAGFLSLGYADGMYLKYGGMDIKNINLTDLSTNYRSYILLEMIVSGICFILALFFNNFTFAAFAVGSFCINIIGYYKNLYQAVGEYRLYGKALNNQIILLFVMNMVLLFIVNSDDSKLYILIQVITAFFVMIYLTVLLDKYTSFLKKGKISIKQIYNNVISGFTLMLGNFSSSIFTGVDRWFVKIFMQSSYFAYYSFAVSLENIVNVFITPITISLYNVFCKNREIDYVLKIKRYTLMWGLVIIAAVYPVKYIIIHFLSQYISAIEIIFPLFAAQAFYVVIKGIYVNLYKAECKQKRYFAIMLCMIVISVILNSILYLIFKSVNSFAIATFLTALIWFVYCELETKMLRFNFKEYITISLLLMIYFFTINIESSLVGLIIYIVAYLSVSALLMTDTVKSLIYMITPFIKRKRL